jgi:hypothetical protein
MDHFWTNTIWYVLLGILTVIELIFVLVKVNNRRLTLAFYITLAGITLNFETIILIFLRAYAYYPMILHKHSDPFNDVLAGNLFSQFSVSATVLLVTVLNLKYYWYIMFAVIYGIIEESFLALGVYSHNWYQTWMTMVSLLIFFWIAKIMYEKITTGIKPLFYFGYIYLGLFTLDVITLLWGLDLAGYMRFTTTLLHDPKISRYGLYLVYFTLASIVMMYIYFSRPKWCYKALVTLMLYGIYYIGYKLNLIWFREGLFLPITTITIFWMYISIFILDNLYGGLEKF